MMKVKILIEFEVRGTEDDDGIEDEIIAESAAKLAAFDHLCFSNTGESVVEEVEVHVDGHGTCRLKLCENDE